MTIFLAVTFTLFTLGVFAVTYLGGKWTIMVTTQKRNPTWTDMVPPSEKALRELRDLVWKKYQRKRLPWERVAELDRLLGDEPLPRPQ